MPAFEPFGGDVAGGARGNRRPDLPFGEGPLEHGLELRHVAEQVAGLARTDDVPVRLEIRAHRQHAVGGVLDEPDVAAAAVEGRRRQRRDADVDALEEAVVRLERPPGGERHAIGRQRVEHRAHRLVAHDGDARLRVALEHAGERRDGGAQILAVGARAAPADHHPIETAQGERRRRVPELTRKHGPARAQRRELRLERGRRELHAVRLAGEHRRQAPPDQVGRRSPGHRRPAVPRTGAR